MSQIFDVFVTWGTNRKYRTTMPIEIERKFLVTDDGWKQSVVKAARIRDGLVNGRKVRVRARRGRGRGRKRWDVEGTRAQEVSTTADDIEFEIKRLPRDGFKATVHTDRA
jgi:CYTH domain-containing protein